ncbi:MAG: hypothetical protein ACSHXK_17250, partial [Oceanococcus sp.]
MVQLPAAKRFMAKTVAKPVVRSLSINVSGVMSTYSDFVVQQATHILIATSLALLGNLICPAPRTLFSKPFTTHSAKMITKNQEAFAIQVVARMRPVMAQFVGSV